jgi:hypothetical protein
MSVKDEAGNRIKGPVPKDERQNVRIKGSVFKKPSPAAERTRQGPNPSEIMKGRLKTKLQVNNTKYDFVLLPENLRTCFEPSV